VGQSKFCLSILSRGTITGVTFLLYKDEQGGAPLWMETQKVQADKNGRYSVMGSTRSEGLPTDVFVWGEARCYECRAVARV
jgi:hypothetical protein